MIIQSKRVYINETFVPASLVIEDGKITDILEYNAKPCDIDYEDHKIIPGLIEIHCHGYNGMDANHANVDGMRHWIKEIAKEGVTSFYPTTSTCEEENILHGFEVVTQMMEEKPEGANVLGIHVEGPQISFEFKGAHDPYLIRKPDVEEFKRWQEVAKGNIRLITIAPEMDKDHALIKYCKETGVNVSIGHSGAKYDECVKASENGAGSFTHTFNGMRGVHHREPGTAGASMSMDHMYSELICDGVHVHYAVAKSLARCKGKDKLILVTDAVQIKGLKPGIYEMPGRWVQVFEDGCGRLKDGRLAGSSNKQINMIKNLVRECGIDETWAINAATINPATFMQIENKGLIKSGYDADIVVIDDDYNVIQTYVLGKTQL